VVLAQDGAAERFEEAVRYQGELLLVQGGAGTGKTTLIAARFRALVARGLAPHRLLVLVPSAARARALSRLLEDQLERGYERLFVLTPPELAAVLLGVEGEEEPALGAADRVAMLFEQIEALSLRHHDFGGNVSALVGGFVRRIDRLKAELIGPEEYAAWAAGLARACPEDPSAAAELEFAEVYRAHERLLAEAGVRDEGGLIRDALRLLGERPAARRRFEHILIDDAHELDLAPASLARALSARDGLTVAGDPHAALRRFRAAGAERLASFASPGARVITLERSWRCRARVRVAAGALVSPTAGAPVLPSSGALVSPGQGVVAPLPPRAAAPASSPASSPCFPPAGPDGGELCFWACAGERGQAQTVAADIERLIARERVAPGRVAVLVPSVVRQGREVAVALEERAVPHRLIGEASFFQRIEVRDLLAWLRLLADPTDAGAVVRALMRPPIELRAVDIARCTQIARRRKLDMVAALAAATESPQVPPEARERIGIFLKLHRAAAAEIDVTSPDRYVQRLIERLGLRRQQLFAAQADVVERLRALGRFGELASAYARRMPHATAREFARRIATVADIAPPMLHEQEEPELAGAPVVQVLAFATAGGLEVDHVYVLGADQHLRAPASEPIPDALLREPLPVEDEASAERALRQQLYVAISRARERVVFCRPSSAPAAACAAVEDLRSALGCEWEQRPEELFGPAEALHSTYRLLRDELLEGTMRAGGRLGELRFDTDLDVSHAVVRYLELLKVAALIARPDGQPLEEALRDVNARILQAVSAEQREIFSSSALDEYLLAAERDARRRAQAIAARDEPSLEGFLPIRGEGVVLSASDIDTYRSCPLRYKFARVFRIPAEPTLHQRFGILVHQVLERFHAAQDGDGSLAELLGLLDAAWRRAGFGDSEQERQLRAKALGALTRYHERFRSSKSEPLWFERQFAFRIGPHLLRGRVDRVDRLPSGEYELIDYKTGRPKTPAQLAEDVQLSLYALGAREAWELESSRQAYYYLLDDRKLTLPGDGGGRAEWVREAVEQVAAGIRSQEFEPTPSLEACSACDYRLICPAAEH
jgi:DNA helicase-2/ATP-dependent DNA helicase PcrA